MKPKAASGAYDEYRCPMCKEPIHINAETCFSCGAEIDEPEIVRNVPMEDDAVEAAIDSMLEGEELRDYPWYAKVDPEIVAVSKDSRALSDKLRQSMDMGSNRGDMRIDFHLNTIISRMVSDWGGYPKSDFTFEMIPAEKLTAAYSLWKDAMADVVASLPDRNVRDANSGKMVDPFVPVKQAFPGGTKQANIAAAVDKARDIFDGVWASEKKAVNQASAKRNYLNFLEILQQVGMGDDDVTKGVDKYTKSMYGKSAAQAKADEQEFMNELEVDALVGDSDKQDFMGGTMYKKTEMLSSAADRVLDQGLSLLADYSDNVDRVMDFLMSSHNELSQQEWEEVEDQLEQYVAGLVDSVKKTETVDSAIDGLLEDEPAGFGDRPELPPRDGDDADPELDAFVKEKIDSQIGLESADADAVIWRGEPTVWVALKIDHPWREHRKEASKEQRAGMQMEMQETADELIDDLDRLGYGSWHVHNLDDMWFRLQKNDGTEESVTEGGLVDFPVKPIKYEGNIPPSFKRWAELNADKIEEIDNEGGYESDGPTNDYWLYLRPGWRSVGMESHTIHEDTFREIRAMWKYGIEPCECDSCEHDKKQYAAAAGEVKPAPKMAVATQKSPACATCGGLGELIDDDDYIAHTTPCPDCKGTTEAKVVGKDVRKSIYALLAKHGFSPFDSVYQQQGKRANGGARLMLRFHGTEGTTPDASAIEQELRAHLAAYDIKDLWFGIADESDGGMAGLRGPSISAGDAKLVLSIYPKSREAIEAVIDEMTGVDSDGNKFKIQPMLGAFGVKAGGKVHEVDLEGHRIVIDGEVTDYNELAHLFNASPLRRLLAAPSVTKHGGPKPGDDDWNVMLGKKIISDPEAAFIALYQNVAV